MKTIVLYTTRHGSTEVIAKNIASKLNADVCNILKEPIPNLREYEAIIIGAPIYLGSINPKMTALIERNTSTLLSKKLGLFLVCLMDEELAADQFNTAYGNELLSHSTADGFFGGKMPENMLNPIEKIITHVAFRHKPIHEDILTTEVEKFIEIFKA
jgi:menaquinone-dependent protoporphyrinogen oxidase